jgi:hypothetical protein
MIGSSSGRWSEVKVGHWARKPWAPHILALALYTLTAVVAMGALVANLGTAVPGGHDTDYYQTHWSLWWVRFALSHGWDPMFTDWVLYPLRHNLSIHMLTPALLPPYLVLEPLFGRVAAVNLIGVGAVILSAYVMFVFLRNHLRLRREPGWADDALALVGGFVFGFLPYEIGHAANSHLNLTPIFWVPLVFWLLDRASMAGEGRRRVVWAVALGMALWGAWLTDLQYLMWIPLLGVFYALYLLARAETWQGRAEMIGLGVLAVCVTLALGAIVPLPALLQVDSSQFAPADLYTPRLFSMPPGSLFLMPGAGDQNFGRLLVLFALGGVLLTVPAFRRRAAGDGALPRERWLWLAMAVIPFLLALGPDIEVGGRLIPLPYRILHDLMNGQYRNPVRFSVPGVFALMMFCALSWGPAWARLRRADVVAGGLLVLFALDLGILAPFPILKPPDYAIYHEIGEEAGDWVIFEVPVGTHSGWTGIGNGQYLMYYAPEHEKRLVNGTLSRMPWQYHYVLFEAPLLMGFAGNALDTQAVPRELARAVDEWPVGYVIVHPDLLLRARMLEYVGLLNMQTSICFYKAEDGLLIYRAHWHPAGCPPRTPPQDESGAYVLDLGVPGDEGFIGEFWYWQEDVGGVLARWAGGNDASRLRLELPPGSDYEMTLVATGYGEGRTARVDVNGATLGTIELPGGWTEHTIRVPAEVVGEGDLVIVLSHGRPISAAERGESADERPLTAAYDRIIFRAAGGDDGR